MRVKQWVFILFLSTIAMSLAAQVAQTPARAVRPDGATDTQLHCPTVIVYERGIADNFGGGTDPVAPSLALDALLQTGTAVPYDAPAGCDVWFGDSFKVDDCVFCCGICSATLEITMQTCGSSLDCNDAITVGQAPFSGTGFILWQGLADPNGCPGGPGPGDPLPVDINPAADRAPAGAARRTTGQTGSVTRRIPLDPRKLQALVCEKKVRSIDVFVQDDRRIDSMRLIITKP